MNPTVIEILTEEPSMNNFLRVILPKILPEDYAIDVNCFIRPHEGKSHLKKSIPKKMRAYPHFGYPVKVLVIQDQDSNNCKKLKQELIKLCENSNAISFVVRIACKELENWYLGDMRAIETVYPESKATQYQNWTKYRNPDSTFGAYEMKMLTKKFTKSHASREIPKYINVEENKSKSFHHLITGLNKLLEA